ncbi:MAG: diphosphomevalonate decarboxylase [Chloroflexi bacterium]|nr:diphosphomevalonate decarboxylase [Chloroflexota bacterium]
MTIKKATATAHPNIALIKYWGNIDHELRLPSNGSISMNLGCLETRTTVMFKLEAKSDNLVLNGKAADLDAQKRITVFMNRVRELAGITDHAHIVSENNFPAGVGIASSSSAYAALSLAATKAAGLSLSERELSRLARTGSGSACRSIPEGFTEWITGDTHNKSYAESIAPPDHWNLKDCIAIVSQDHKEIGSTQGHEIAETSPLQASRIASAPERLDICRQSLLERDFKSFAEVVELDCNMMHAVMMTSNPTLLYWEAATLSIIKAVQSWRMDGLQVCYTIDAGPNVHVLCPNDIRAEVAEKLSGIPGVQKVITAGSGGRAQII